jgi:hypothetical protein
MKKWLCWLLGHDHMVTSGRRRVCLSRYFGTVMAWEEVTGTGIGAAR